MNLGFGSFRVVNYGKDKMLVNYVFPHHPEVGQVTFEYFETAVKAVKGASLKVVHSMDYPTAPFQSGIQRLPAAVTEGQNRALASKSEQLDNQEDQPNLSIFWLVVALGFTGGLFRMSNRKAHK